MHSKSPRLLTSLACFALLLSGAARAEILYEERFSGASGVPLAGAAPSERRTSASTSGDAVWKGPQAHACLIEADGTLRAVKKDHEGASCFLPFRPQSDQVYLVRLSGVRVTGGDWIAGGFSLADQPVDTERFRDNKPTAWGLLRRPGSPLFDQAVAGPEAAGAVDARTRGAGDLSILLDTRRPEAWVVRWFFDGRLMHTTSMPPAPIKWVGFGTNTAQNAPAAEPARIGFFTLRTVEAGADSDRDALPDSWELVYFRRSPRDDVQTTLAREDNASDSDGDGFSNYEEFVGGSSPIDPIRTPLDANGDGRVDHAR